jgi:hypothetical protein
MRAAGVRLINGTVEALRLPGPRELQPDEILIDVRAQHALVIPSIRSYPLAQAGEALALARHGAGGAGLVLHPSPATRS